MYTSRRKGMVEQIRPYKYGIDRGRRAEGRGWPAHTRGCKYRADEFLHPLPVMHDAMLLTLYTPTETTLFPRFLLRHLRLVVPEDFADLVETRPRLFISIYFDHRSPHLYPSASSRLVTKQRISQYILSPLKIILYRHRASFSIVIYGD